MNFSKRITAVIFVGMLFLTMIPVAYAQVAGEQNAADEIAFQEDTTVYTPLVSTPPKPVEPKMKTAVWTGKINPSLEAKLAQQKSDEKIPIAIWIKTAEITPVKRDGVVDDNQRSAQAAQVSNAIADAEKPVKERLQKDKIEIIYASTYAPVIFANVNKADIQSLSAMDQVVSIDPSIEYGPYLNNAGPAILSPKIWAYSKAGWPKVSIIEDDGVASTNPYLAFGSYYNAASPNVGSHATYCAGIVQSKHTTYKGVNYKGPGILSGNSQTYTDSALMAATDWSISQGARVLSNSWGTTCPYSLDNGLSALAKYEDYIVRVYAVTVVFASGNCGDYGDVTRQYVGDPGRAYNVITVGSYNDRDSGWVWTDDIMSPFSSSKDVTGLAQKPDLVAPGEGILSTLTASPWVGAYGSTSGTSYAAPAVSGTAALIMNKSPYLGTWPEVVKAIVMASADHNIEGLDRYSDYDGAGGMNSYGAYGLASYIGTKAGGAVVPYAAGVPVNFPSDNGVSLIQGKMVKAVITWDSRSTGYNGADALNSDLDLWLERRTGTSSSGYSWIYEDRCRSSQSVRNNFEIVQCNIPQSGYYRIHVYKWSWTDAAYAEYLGWALYQRDA